MPCTRAMAHLRDKQSAAAVQQRVRDGQPAPQVPKAKKHACPQCVKKFRDAQAVRGGSAATRARRTAGTPGAEGQEARVPAVRQKVS